MNALNIVSLEDLTGRVEGIEQFAVDRMLKLYGSGFLEFNFMI